MKDYDNLGDCSYIALTNEQFIVSHVDSQIFSPHTNQGNLTNLAPTCTQPLHHTSSCPSRRGQQGQTESVTFSFDDLWFFIFTPRFHQTWRKGFGLPLIIADDGSNKQSRYVYSRTFMPSHFPQGHPADTCTFARSDERPLMSTRKKQYISYLLDLEGDVSTLGTFYFEEVFYSRTPH